MYLLYDNYSAAYLADCDLKGIPAEDCNLGDKILQDFKSANYIYVLVALVLFMISNLSRVLRWHQMLEPLGYRPHIVNSLGSVMIGYLVNLGIPRSGEFVRAGILSKYEGFQAEKVMGTIVTDRIMDVLCLLVVIMLSLVLSYDTIGIYLEENMDLSGKLAFVMQYPLLIGLVGAGIMTSLLLAWRYRTKVITSTIGAKVVNLLEGLWAGIKSIRELRRPGLFVMHSVIIWLMYYLMTYICMFAFVPTENLGAVVALVVFVLGTLGFVFPAPGGMGAYHFMIGQGLAIYGIPEADGFSFANIFFFSVQLGCNVLLGLIALAILPSFNRGR